MQRLGEKLRALREQRGMSTRQLAAQLDISSPGYISKLETGKQKPSLALLLKIALFFNVSTDQLLKDDLKVE